MRVSRQHCTMMQAQSRAYGACLATAVGWSEESQSAPTLSSRKLQLCYCGRVPWLLWRRAQEPCATGPAPRQAARPACAQASWVKMGPERAARLLACGANDMGGSLMNESITRAAGAPEHAAAVQGLGPALAGSCNAIMQPYMPCTPWLAGLCGLHIQQPGGYVWACLKD